MMKKKDSTTVEACINEILINEKCKQYLKMMDTKLQLFQQRIIQENKNMIRDYYLTDNGFVQVITKEISHGVKKTIDNRLIMNPNSDDAVVKFFKDHQADISVILKTNMDMLYTRYL